MTVDMHLYEAPFARIVRKEKTIELRLNDPKRQAIAIGDRILFRCGEQRALVEVRARHVYPDFPTMFRALDMKAYGEDTDPAGMEAYYTPAQQKQYGVLGLEIALLSCQVPTESDILYTDTDILVLCKHPGQDSEHFYAPSGQALYCVHRLDRETGGIMVFAWHRRAAAALSQSIADGALEKTYLAVCHGTPSPKQGHLEDLLYHDSRANKSFVVNRQRKGVQKAILDYAVLETARGESLLRVQLHTGRTHQIRVQLAHQGHPLQGDRRYGSRASGGLALWAHTLAFPHPRSGAPLHFICPCPSTLPWSQFSSLAAHDQPDQERTQDA